MTQTAAIYVRISRDPGSDRLGVERQRRACEDLCDRNGWTVADVYEDDDVSAFSGRIRPAYRTMLDDLAAGTVDALVAWAPDRFTRSTRELEDLIDAVESAGAIVSTVQAGPYDLSTPSGRMAARVVGSVARFESEHKSERVRAKHAELAERGMVSGGGTRGYGFEDDRVTIRESEAREIRDAAAKVLDGWGLRTVCNDFADRGVVTVTGGKWTPHVLRRLLTSARVAGKRDHRGNLTDAVWPAILDDTTWHTIRAVLLDPDRNTRRGRPAQRLLTGGIARCSECGADLVSRPKSPTQPSYVCATGPGFKGCGKIRVMGDPLDDLVSAMVLEALRDVDLRAHLADPGARDIPDDLAADVTRLEAQLDALADDYADGTLGRGAYAKATARVESRLTDARRSIASTVRRTSPMLDASIDVTAAWPTMTTDERRERITAVVDHVIVAPAVKGRNTFDPDRVSVVWKV